MLSFDVRPSSCFTASKSRWINHLTYFISITFTEAISLVIRFIFLELINLDVCSDDDVISKLSKFLLISSDRWFDFLKGTRLNLFYVQLWKCKTVFCSVAILQAIVFSLFVIRDFFQCYKMISRVNDCFQLCDYLKF